MRPGTRPAHAARERFSGAGRGTSASAGTRRAPGGAGAQGERNPDAVKKRAIIQAAIERARATKARDVNPQKRRKLLSVACADQTDTNSSKDAGCELGVGWDCERQPLEDLPALLRIHTPCLAPCAFDRGLDDRALFSPRRDFRSP